MCSVMEHAEDRCSASSSPPSSLKGDCRSSEPLTTPDDCLTHLLAVPLPIIPLPHSPSSSPSISPPSSPPPTASTPITPVGSPPRSPTPKPTTTLHTPPPLSPPSPSSPASCVQSPVTASPRTPVQCSTTDSVPTPPRSPPPACVECEGLRVSNERLRNYASRLRFRLNDAVGMTQTHGQRLLRAAFEQQLEEKAREHAQNTTHMLNLQKNVFEEELQLIETETRQALDHVQSQLDASREENTRLRANFENQQLEALDRTESAMNSVQGKLVQLHARAVRLEREKKQLEVVNNERQIMIEVLASSAAAKEEERRRTDMLISGIERERCRKNELIDSLQSEMSELRKRLGDEMERNARLSKEMMEMRREQKRERDSYLGEIEDCKHESKKDLDRMGRLFASVLSDMPLQVVEPGVLKTED